MFVPPREDVFVSIQTPVNKVISELESQDVGRENEIEDARVKERANVSVKYAFVSTSMFVFIVEVIVNTIKFSANPNPAGMCLLFKSN